MKFSIGDVVVEKTNIRPRTSYNTQKVVGILDGALLVEHHGFAYNGEITPEDYYESEPGSRGWRQSLQRFQESELFTTEEAVAELRNLEAAQSKLTKEFEAVQKQLQSKLNQAATLVKAASAIAKTHNKSFYDLKEECTPLYQALNDGGWSHSHMSC